MLNQRYSYRWFFYYLITMSSRFGEIAYLLLHNQSHIRLPAGLYIWLVSIISKAEKAGRNL